MIYISMNNRTRTNVSRNRARITTSHAYHFRPRVGAYCIRPTNAPERGEYVQNHINVSCALKRIPQNRMNPAYIRKWMTQIHGIRFLPKTFVGRMQYAPTRGRKRYVQGGGVRFLPKTSVGRMQYAPTRGRKWYAQDCGIHDWTQERYVQGRNVLVWDREGRVRSCREIAWAENIKWRECYLVALIEQLSRKNVS